MLETSTSTSTTRRRLVYQVVSLVHCATVLCCARYEYTEKYVMFHVDYSCVSCFICFMFQFSVLQFFSFEVIEDIEFKLDILDYTSLV